MAVTDDETLLTGGGSAWNRFDQMIEIGDVVAGYRIEAVAGAGGMGVVYRASEPGLERSVALKVILPEFAGDPGFRDLFIRESTTAAALEHPNVIPVYRAGEDGGHLYIAMRFVEGESLDHLIARRGRLAPGRAARLIAQVAGALDTAHERGLIHRDVKPANVMIVDPEGEEHAYLTDFGLTVSRTEGARGRSGRWAGTPGYLAPEQITARKADRRADVYALGCVLFRALTGRAPFTGANEAEVLTAHVIEPPPLVSQVAPDIPRGFDAVVRRAMAKRAEDRYATAGELARAALSVRFDLYLCHGPDDREIATTVADALRENGLEPWVGARRAAHDRDWLRDATEALRCSDACAVLIGRAGLGEWAREELATAQEIASVERGFRILGVLLPGAPEPFDPSLAILANRPWVDLRAGVDDPDGLGDLLRATRGELRLGPPLAAIGADVCPYRGLEPFGEDQAELFFGREEEISRAVERLRGARFLVVLGPSGSGKSSLIRAGVVPSLRRGALPGSESWTVCIFAPGAQPLTTLAAQLGAAGVEVTPDELVASEQTLDRAAGRALAGRSPGECVVVVVDQLEEVFTLCPNPVEASAFLANLRYAATIPGGRVVVLMSLRADFYPRCAEDPELRTLVAAQQLLLGPLDADNLRRAVEEPARLAGLELEPGLVRRILADVADRPGALPLLEHLLLELWHRRVRGRVLTLEAYAASGGVEGALAKRANAVYGGLDPDRQSIARRLLLRLTQPGEGTEDTRRRASLDELVTRPGERLQVEAVVEAMAEARLLTTGIDEVSGSPIVEITHEALIRGWPELRRWINDARERLRLERRLTEAAREWHQGGRDDGLLYRGARLSAWQDHDLAELSALERQFLDAGRERAARERVAGRRRVRITIAGLAVALAAITAVAVLAIVRGNEATDQRDLARSRAIAASAASQLPVDPELSLLLAEQAYRVRPTVEAEEILRQATYDSRVRAAVLGMRPVYDASFSPDGRLVAMGGADGEVRLWDWRSGGVVTLGRHQGAVFASAFSPDGRRLASGGADGVVRVWDVSARRQVGLLHIGTALPAVGGAAFISDLAFSPDGRSIMAGGGQGVLKVVTQGGWRTRRTGPNGTGGVLVWRWSQPGEVLPLALATPTPVLSVAFGRRGAAFGDYLGRVYFWSGRPGSRPRRLAPRRSGPSPEIESISFVGDGRTLLSTDGNGRVQVINAKGGAAPPELRPPRRAFTVDVASDGRHVLSVRANGASTVWDQRGIDPAVSLRGHSGVVESAAFDVSGRHVVTASDDGSVRVWYWRGGEVPDMLATDQGPVLAIGFTSDGRNVVAETDTGAFRSWSFSGRGRVVRQGLGQRVLVAAFSSNGREAVSGDGYGVVTVRGSAGDAARGLHEGAVNGVAISADLRRVASGGQDGHVYVLDWMTGRAPIKLSAHQGGIDAVALSGDGRLVASGGDDGTVAVRDLRAPRAEPPSLLGGPGGGGHRGAVTAVAFDRDGGLVASGGQDGTVRVWDWRSTSARPASVLRGDRGAVTAVAFDRSGGLVASGGQDGTVRVWDWKHRVRVLALHGHRGGVRTVAFGPDGRWVASGGQDGTVRLWRCEVCGPIQDVRRLAVGRVTRALTASERQTFLEQPSG